MEYGWKSKTWLVETSWHVSITHYIPGVYRLTIGFYSGAWRAWPVIHRNIGVLINSGPKYKWRTRIFWSVGSFPFFRLFGWFLTHNFKGQEKKNPDRPSDAKIIDEGFQRVHNRKRLNHPYSYEDILVWRYSLDWSKIFHIVKMNSLKHNLFHIIEWRPHLSRSIILP